MRGQDLKILFGIFPDPESEKSETFTFQFANIPNLYSHDMEHLINLIISTESSLDLENLIDKFFTILNEHQNRLKKLLDKIKIREEKNFRELYFLFNEKDGILENDNDYIWIGGPIGKGIHTIDYNLDELYTSRYVFLKFNSDDIAHDLETIKLKINKKEISIRIQDNNEIIGLNLDNENTVISKYKIVNAYKLIENELDQLYSITDFSPLLDSSLSAINMSLSYNFGNLKDYPEILKQQFKTYNIEDYNDLLGMRKLCIENNNQFEIIGYSVYKQDDFYTISSNKLFKGLKYILIANVDIYELMEFNKTIQTDKSLNMNIQSYLKDIEYFGKEIQYDSRAYTQFYQLIGYPVLNNLLSTKRKANKYPLYFFRFEYNSLGDRVLTTNIGLRELPIEYINVLDNISKPLYVLDTGPLELFDFETNSSSLFIKIGDFIFEIYVEFDDINDENTYYGIIYLFSDNLEKYLANRKIKRKIDNNLYNMKPKMAYEYYTKESYRIIDNIQPDYDCPLINYARNILSNSLNKITLNRIISQIDMPNNNDNDFNRIIEEERLRDLEELQISRYSDNQNLDELIAENIRFESESIKISKKLDKIEKKINYFNPHLFSFILNKISREQIISDDISFNIERIFYDMRIALVDFGLNAEIWYYADPLQLFQAYETQLKWIKHKFATIIRQYTEIDENDIDNLVKIHRDLIEEEYGQYNILGNEKGDKYLELKYLYLFYTPKLNKYKIHANTLKELLLKIKAKDKEMINKIVSKLPKLIK